MFRPELPGLGKAKADEPEAEAGLQGGCQQRRWNPPCRLTSIYSGSKTIPGCLDHFSSEPPTSSLVVLSVWQPLFVFNNPRPALTE